jgi:5-methyltetrahydropteroyltriglutamate--homocysteine methyltransferase
MSIKTTTLGLPRIGAERELKWAQEKYWRSEITQEELLSVAKTIRHTNWTAQRNNKISWIPSNDFSFYDQVLDTSVLFNVVPDRYKDLLNDVSV